MYEKERELFSVELRQLLGLFCLIWFFTSQSTIFQVCQDGSSWAEPVPSKDYVPCSRTQRSDAGEAWTRNPSIWSQTLYHWSTVLPKATLSAIRLIYRSSNNWYGLTYCTNESLLISKCFKVVFWCKLLIAYLSISYSKTYLRAIITSYQWRIYWKKKYPYFSFIT